MPKWPLNERYLPEPKQYICGHCDSKVGTETGWVPVDPEDAVHLRIYICTYCQLPTLFNRDKQIPARTFGRGVGHIPKDVKELYNEARRCISVNAYTASVLACRKILMNIAVNLKAESGKPFIYYVEYLSDKGYVPPNGKHWVDHIRETGNEANHEIEPMGIEDAARLLTFVEGLLRFIFEFPNRIPGSDVQG